MRAFGILVAAAIAAQGATSATRVFDDGVHYLTETKVFTAADSGTVWKAAPGAKPVISGARKVTGWRQEENGLWSADVPWVTSRERGFRQLVVNGELRPRARHPNQGYFRSLETPRPKNVSWHDWEYRHEKMRFQIKAGEVDSKWNFANAEVIFYHIWVDSHCIPQSLTGEQGTNWFNLAVGVKRNPCNSKWRLENLKEIADEPGEWALDYAAKKVWYRPLANEDLSKLDILVPDVETLVRIDGAKDLRFEGLTFADSRFELRHGDRNDTQASYTVAAAVVLTNAENCVFEDCTFTRLSGYALDFQAGTRDCRVTKCRLVRLGAGGVRLNSFQRGGCLTTANGVTRYQMHDPRLLVSGNEITDCEIADFGRDFPSAVGVLCMAAEGTKVLHNSIHDGYYTGVSVGWEWGYMPSVARDNLVEYNHIYNIGKGLLSDMGGIYLLGVAPGTKVRNNLIHDVDAAYYGGWGIYPDEGSTGLLIENNIVYNTKFANFHQHFGRNNTVRNNIFAGGRIDQLACSRWEPHTRLFFYNNIVYWQQGDLHTGRWEDKTVYEFTRVPRELRSNNTLKLIKTSECDYNLYFNPKLALKDVKWGTQKCTWEAWHTNYYQDVHSVWGDPMFVDAAKHDYRLKPDSPALKLGFRPIDMSTVGPRTALAATTVGCTSIPDAKNAHLRTGDGPLIQAHRGGRCEYEDNAAGGFARSLQRGIRGFETDVRFSKDHELVIMHDGNVNRTSDSTGTVERLTWDELRNCRLKACSEPIASAADVFDAFRHRDDMFIEIEMKAYPSEFYTEEVLTEYCRKLYALATAKLASGTFAFTCFNTNTLGIMRREFPDAPLGLIMWDLTDENLKMAKALKCCSVAPGLHTPKAMVDKAHAEGLLVCLWMVQDAWQYAEAKAKGADRVTSDYPHLLDCAIRGQRKRLVAMDLDATLCQHRSPIPPANLLALQELTKRYKCIIVGAGNAPRIYRQMNNFPIDIVANYGMQVAEAADGKFRIVKAVTNSVDQEFFRRETDKLRKKYGYIEYAGEPLEFHASGMVTFGLLGTSPAAEHKIAFDPDRKKRRAMYPEVCQIFKDYSVYIGGSTSFDFAGPQYNKYDATLEWAKAHGYELEDIVFIGDDFADGGGDSHVRIKDMDHIVITDYRNFASAVDVLLK